eukprot:4046646-Karenia_brevis.AAC.1
MPRRSSRVVRCQRCQRRHWHRTPLCSQCQRTCYRFYVVHTSPPSDVIDAYGNSGSDPHHQECGGSNLLERCDWTHLTIPNETLFDTESDAFPAGDVVLHTLSTHQQVARGWQHGGGSSSGGSGLAGGEGGS